jgi:hypothetical protein
MNVMVAIVLLVVDEAVKCLYARVILQSHRPGNRRDEYLSQPCTECLSGRSLGNQASMNAHTVEVRTQWSQFSDIRNNDALFAD